MSIDTAQVLQRLNARHGSRYSALKPRQVQALELCAKNHVVAVLPTGYGKTVIIQALPYLNETHDTCVIVVNPLNAIIDEQEERFGERCVVINEELIKEHERQSNLKRQAGEDTTVEGPPTAAQAKAADNLEKLMNGDVNFIIGHPENLMNPALKNQYMKEPLATKLSHIIVDEAHVIISWGKSDFRPAYLKLGELRTTIRGAQVLALTATASKAAQKEIKDVLRIKNASIIWESPDRPNVYLSVHRRPPTTGGENTVEVAYDSVLDPITEKLAKDGPNFEKTIIYLPLKWCGHAHHRALCGALKNHPAETTVQSVESDEMTCLISQYHAPQTKGMKSRITKAMRNPTGNLRLLLASEAYGMGADAPDVRHVVHLGPPNSIERYVQEIGRCGRDGHPARATLYFNNNDTGSNVTHLHDDMRQYCKIETCRREHLMQYFGSTLPDPTNLHTCCDNCLAKCQCTTCVPCPCPKISETKAELVPAGMAACAECMLLSYFRDENALYQNSMVPEAITGLSEKLAKKLSKEVIQYADTDLVKKTFPLLKESYRTNIVGILATALNAYKQEN